MHPLCRGLNSNAETIVIPWWLWGRGLISSLVVKDYYSKYSANVWCHYGYFIAPIGYGASLISNTFDICDPTSGRLDGSRATANEKQEVSVTRCWVLLQNSAYAIFSAKIPPIFFFVLRCKTQQLRMFCCEIAAEVWFLQTAGLWVILDESLSVFGGRIIL